MNVILEPNGREFVINVYLREGGCTWIWFTDTPSHWKKYRTPKTWRKNYTIKNGHSRRVGIQKWDEEKDKGREMRGRWRGEENEYKLEKGDDWKL